MSDDATNPPATHLEHPVPTGTLVDVRTARGTSRARIIRELGRAGFLVEVIDPAPGLVRGERLDVPRQRVHAAEVTG